MKKVKLLELLLILSVCIAGTACVSKEVSSSKIVNNTFTVKLDELNSKPNGSSPQLVVQEINKSNEKPTLYHFASKSDYVGKVKKQEKLDLSDEVAGFLYSFRVERMICSKDSFSSIKTSQDILLNDFQIFVPVGIRNEKYKNGQRYLIFLQQIPKEEKLSEIYVLDQNKIYFRAFEGEKSIFPSEGGDFHGPPKKGIIDLSSLKYQDLAQRIEDFCLAINESDLETKLEKLRSLTKSTDEELQINAKFAIEVLQNANK